jgi:hypothetical protein
MTLQCIRDRIRTLQVRRVQILRVLPPADAGGAEVRRVARLIRSITYS